MGPPPMGVMSSNLHTFFFAVSGSGVVICCITLFLTGRASITLVCTSQLYTYVGLKWETETAIACPGYVLFTAGHVLAKPFLICSTIQSNINERRNDPFCTHLSHGQQLRHKLTSTSDFTVPDRIDDGEIDEPYLMAN